MGQSEAKLGQHDWYRSTTWNEDIVAAFEKRLARSRKAFSKVQYLRIQGLYLLGSQNPLLQEAGVSLTERAIREFPEQTTEVACAHETLADYFLRQRRYEDAELELRWVLGYYKTQRDGTSGIADLKLVELVLLTKQESKYTEARKILKELLEGSRSHFRSDLPMC